MSYIDIAYYKELYGEIEERLFNRLSFDACRKIDQHTTGVDGVKKLRIAFPKAEYDMETVKRCAANLVSHLFQIEEAEKAAALGRGYEQGELGLQRKIVSRVESGNEAISYSETSGTDTAVDKAVSSRADRERLIANVIREYLDGITDANGVSLLYMGPYPHRT